MSEPFIAEIRLFGLTFAPRGFAACDGQLLPINQNQALFSLLGTTYGGDGRTTFALPDLRGRSPLHSNGPHPLGQRSGEETHVLTVAEIPAHSHALRANSTNASEREPEDNVLANSLQQIYRSPDPAQATSMNGIAANAGSSTAYLIMHPFLTINFCIAIQGLFPSRN